VSKRLEELGDLTISWTLVLVCPMPPVRPSFLPALRGRRAGREFVPCLYLLGLDCGLTLYLTHQDAFSPPLSTVVPAGTRGVPAGEALAVFVYEEQYKDAFSSLPRYHAGGGGASEASAGAEEGEMAIDGVSLLKFLHKLVRNGSIKDKGPRGRRRVSSNNLLRRLGAPCRGVPVL